MHRDQPQRTVKTLARFFCLLFRACSYLTDGRGQWWVFRLKAGCSRTCFFPSGVLQLKVPTLWWVVHCGVYGEGHQGSPTFCPSSAGQCNWSPHSPFSSFSLGQIPGGSGNVDNPSCKFTLSVSHKSLFGGSITRWCAVGEPCPLPLPI